MNKKRILSIVMAFCIIIGMVFGTHTNVLAKSQAVKITFNGKSITMAVYRGAASNEPKSLIKVEAKLGKKTRLAKGNEEWAGYAYVWKKGKTKLIIMDDSEATGAKNLGYACVEIKDENGSLDGIKVGMTKSKALKKLKNLYGSKNVRNEKNNIGAYNIEVKIKNNKVSSIFWMRS